MKQISLDRSLVHIGLIQVDRPSLALTFIPMGNFKAVFSSWDNSEAKHTEEF